MQDLSPHIRSIDTECVFLQDIQVICIYVKVWEALSSVALQTQFLLATWTQKGQLPNIFYFVMSWGNHWHLQLWSGVPEGRIAWLGWNCVPKVVVLPWLWISEWSADFHYLHQSDSPLLYSQVKAMKPLQ